MSVREGSSGFLRWCMVLTLSALTAACGGGGGGQDPILGTGGLTPPAGAVAGAPAGAIAPGATCTVSASPTIPTVTASDPSNGNQSATTSTSGAPGGGKRVSASFSLPMNPATLNSSPAGTLLTFTLKETLSGANVPGTVAMNGANTVATLTTTAALVPDRAYTAVITQAATSATGTPLSCIYSWAFKTATPAATGLAPVDLGRVAPFGIAATGGVTSTAGATTINGNVVLDPTATCNAVTVGAAGTFGLCGGFAPILNGQVISPLFPDAGITSGAVKADLLAAFLSITPSAGPPGAGSRDGATNIPAGTTMGALAGSPFVQGDNYFVSGLYQSLTSILITGDLTLDAQGDSNALFIFQSSSSIGTAAGVASPGVHTRILLINGAKASNVYWQAGTSVTLGTNSEFQGNILASANITMTTGATSCGRLLAGAFTAGSFVLDANVVSVPGNVNAPASCQ